MFSAGVALGLRAGQHGHVTNHLSHCRWCDPPAIHEATRTALRWSTTGRARPRLANTLSNVTFAATHVWALESLLGSAAANTAPACARVNCVASDL
ncbi:MAG: hypothetical protein QM820_43520 [Minicystis sp.]